MLGKQLQTAAAGNAGGEVLGIEDVFSTWLWTGNGSTQTITNGIDLAGEGGMVWTKVRSLSDSHYLADSERKTGTYYDELASNQTYSSQTTRTWGITSLNSDGFSLGGSNNQFNASGQTYASWTFRKAEKFFDVVTYTGNGTTQNISHNLGSTPGWIVVKGTSGTSRPWITYHRSLGASKNIELQSSNFADTNTVIWNNTAPTDTVFSLGANSNVNANGESFVAYLFAHDAGGFGDDGAESVIKCGSFTATAGGLIPTVALGWEPQWLLIKASSEAGQWYIFDNMRGIVTGGSDAYIMPTAPNAEQSGDFVSLTPTGFSGGASALLGGNATAIYIAIRRGPMKTPTDATTVFSQFTYPLFNAGQKKITGFPVDLSLLRIDPGSASGYPGFYTRLTGGKQLVSSNSNQEDTALNFKFDFSDGYIQNVSQSAGMSWNFRRAAGFFDVVTYTSDGSTDQQVSHNLGVIPELIIVKERSGTGSWTTYHSALGRNGYLYLNSPNGFSAFTNVWGTVDPTSSTFNIRSASLGMGSGDTAIAYLFATCPGVSKVGSYTGTGNTLNVDCGFASGARFVLIKRYDTGSTGDWYVWDTARGIVSGNDPYLRLNLPDAEVTITDYIDPLSTGFQISSSAPAAINALGGSYIFLAIA